MARLGQVASEPQEPPSRSQELTLQVRAVIPDHTWLSAVLGIEAR